jgi:hypothetical protein
MCYIKKNDQFQVLDNGMILFKNKTYALGDCKFEDESQTPNIIEEVEVDFSETRTKPKPDKSKQENVEESSEQVLGDSKKEKQKKERKDKKDKKPIVQPNDKQNDESSQEDEAQTVTQADASINTQPSQMELDMGLPFTLMPQTTQPQPTQGQPTQNSQQVQQQPQSNQMPTPQQIQQWQQWQQMQMQMQQQMPQGIQMPNLQLPPNLSIPQVGIPSVNNQGLAQTVDTTKTTESHIPQEFNMLQDFMKLTGGNLYLAVALVIGVIFYKQWKVNQDKNDDQPSDAHSQSCDQDRKDIAIKIRVLEDRTQTMQQLEKRIQGLEEAQDEGGINIGFSEEIEEKIESLEKQLKEVNKKLNQANSNIDPHHTISIEKPKREYTKKVTNQTDK